MATALYLYQGINGVTPTDGLDMTGNGTDGGNTGALSVSKLGGGSAKFKTAATFGQTFVGEFINAAANAAFARVPFTNASNIVSVARDFVCPALPTTGGNITILSVRNSTQGRILVQLTAAGKIQVLCNGTTLGGGSFPQTGDPSPTAVLAAGTAYRLEVTASGSGTVTTGTVACRIYAYGAAVGTYLGGISDAAAVTGTDAFVSCDDGLGSYAEVRTLRVGNTRLVDGTAAFQGPYVATTPGLTGSGSLSPTTGPTGTSVTCTVTTAGGNGNAKTYQYDWGDGTVEAGITSATRAHTYTTVGSFPVIVSVTQP